MSESKERITATISNISQATESLLSAQLVVEADVVSAYKTPGQYIVLHPEGEEKPVFMALASGPGAAPLELLVGPGAAEKLRLEDGKSIAIDPPGGKGFPIDLAEGKSVILFAVGSGMSAIRSVIEYIRQHRSKFAEVTLYAGAHSDAEHAYKSLDEAWRADGITIHRTNSRPWVQDVFRSQPASVENAVAFVCGMKEMVAGVTEALGEAGLSEELVRQNF